MDVQKMKKETVFLYVFISKPSENKNKKKNVSVLNLRHHQGQSLKHPAVQSPYKIRPSELELLFRIPCQRMAYYVIHYTF